MAPPTTRPPELNAILEQISEERVTELLVDAVAQYSPSFAEEPAMEVFAARLAQACISHLRQPVESIGGTTADSRANLIIQLGPAPPALMWVGHVDTVTMIDEEEQALRREGGILHGLGTADMKSGCAAIIEALLAVVASGVELRRGLCIALVVGEEEYGDGSEALLREHTAPLVVIGEPTGLRPCTDHYSYYECRLTARGTRAHAALPEMGASAIHAMLEWMQQLLQVGGESAFAPGLTINPREIRGGADHFVVAEACEAAIDIHAPPEVGREAIEQLINTARDQALATHPGCTLDFENLFWGPGYATPPDHPLLSPLERAFAALERPWHPGAFRSHSDGSLFHQQGSVPIICGPGRLEVAHTRGEHVELAELHAAARIYAALIHEACIRPAEENGR